jgi:hypothetical protein
VGLTGAAVMYFVVAEPLARRRGEASVLQPAAKLPDGRAPGMTHRPSTRPRSEFAQGDLSNVEGRGTEAQRVS